MMLLPLAFATNSLQLLKAVPSSANFEVSLKTEISAREMEGKKQFSCLRTKPAGRIKGGCFFGHLCSPSARIGNEVFTQTKPQPSKVGCAFWWWTRTKWDSPASWQRPFPPAFFLCGGLTAILNTWIYKGSLQCPAFQKENTGSVENAVDAQKSFCAYVAFKA